MLLRFVPPVFGATPRGQKSEEDGEMVEVEADPSILIELEAHENAVGPPQVGQWSPPVDPVAVLRAIQSYERRLVDMALGSANVSRANSDVRSGYSLAVQREDQRLLQKSYEPVFRRSDLDLIGKVSQLLGGPKTGWRIEYAGVPKSPQELSAEMQRISDQLAAGLLDRITAYQQLHPGLTKAEATLEVEEIDRINSQFAA